jgi:hypothetical protein
MKNRKRHRITITVTDNELEALEDSLIARNLCKKHNAQTWNYKEKRCKTEQEIFKMQDECKECQRYNLTIHRKAWGVASKLFGIWDKNY